MPIQGPLRELGIHDVFQLLDLSRKTGTLQVTSALRDAEGTVLFEDGRVVYATTRGNPEPLGPQMVRAGKLTETELARARELQRRAGRRLGDVLVEMGAVSPKELERQVRMQVEEVVFELMSWREGFFSFEEGDARGAAAEATARISSESLLMEAARRIDEWSRIAHKVPGPHVVPVLADSGGDEHDSTLDLLPSEWEVLAAIDGESDLRRIAATVARSEFDVARVVYGLLSTGVVEIAQARGPAVVAPASDDDPALLVVQSSMLLDEGRLEEALAAARRAGAASPGQAAPLVASARASLRLGRPGEAVSELRAAVALEPDDTSARLELGFAAARLGDLGAAVAEWDRYLALRPSGDGTRVRQARDAAAELLAHLDAHLRGGR